MRQTPVERFVFYIQSVLERPLSSFELELILRVLKSINAAEYSIKSEASEVKLEMAIPYLFYGHHLLCQAAEAEANVSGKESTCIFIDDLKGGNKL